jgi:hypothetical protein
MLPQPDTVDNLGSSNSPPVCRTQPSEFPARYPHTLHLIRESSRPAKHLLRVAGERFCDSRVHRFGAAAERRPCGAWRCWRKSAELGVCGEIGPHYMAGNCVGWERVHQAIGVGWIGCFCGGFSASGLRSCGWHCDDTEWSCWRKAWQAGQSATGTDIQRERRMSDRNSVLRASNLQSVSSLGGDLQQRWRKLSFTHPQNRRDFPEQNRNRPGHSSTMPANPHTNPALVALPKKAARRPDPIILLSPSASSLLRMATSSRFSSRVSTSLQTARSQVPPTRRISSTSHVCCHR